jgi:HEPN domain-containing protein
MKDETPQVLFSKASGDIKTTESLILNKKYFNELSKANGAYHSQQAVEKLLKGFLLYNNKGFEWGHNFKNNYKNALVINKSFVDIKNEIVNLNKYGSAIRYTEEIPVDDKAFSKILKDIKKIYNFPPFQKIYDEFADNIIERIEPNRFDDMIKNYNNILKEFAFKPIIEIKAKIIKENIISCYGKQLEQECKHMQSQDKNGIYYEMNKTVLIETTDCYNKALKNLTNENAIDLHEAFNVKKKYSEKENIDCCCFKKDRLELYNKIEDLFKETVVKIYPQLINKDNKEIFKYFINKGNGGNGNGGR